MIAKIGFNIGVQPIKEIPAGWCVTKDVSIDFQPVVDMQITGKNIDWLQRVEMIHGDLDTGKLCVWLTSHEFPTEIELMKAIETFKAAGWSFSEKS